MARTFAVLASVCIIAGCSALHLPLPRTAEADQMATVWKLFFWAGVFVAALVYALILFPLWRWRRKDGALPPQFRQNAPLETAYTIIPLLIVAGLFLASNAVERRVEALEPSPPLAVAVTAFRWGWRFEYPAERIVVQGDASRPPQLTLPVGRTTRIDLRSVDVIHSFWVPDFLFKRDAIPGFVNRFDLHPQSVGAFRGVCGEFCGLSHADMTFVVRVVTPQDFQRWLASTRARQGAT